MTWFAFHGYAPMDLADGQEKEAVALGFHGYGTYQEAIHNPNSVSWFQKPILNLLEQDYAFAKAHGQQPGGPNSSPGGIIKSDAGDIAKKAIHLGTGTIDDLINWLGQGGLWTRVGEFFVGGILLYVGLKAAVSPAGQDVGKRTFKQTVKTVAKKVPK